VQRRDDPEDARAKRVALTLRGRTFLENGGTDLRRARG